MGFIQNMGLLLVSATIIHLLSLSFNENILELNEFNFESTLEDHKFVMVKFYAPWCKTCKSFQPVYQEIANKLIDFQLSDPIKLAKVDGTNEVYLANKFNILSYPALLFFEKGHLADVYRGNREPTEIINWLLKKTDYIK